MLLISVSIVSYGATTNIMGTSTDDAGNIPANVSTDDDVSTPQNGGFYIGTGIGAIGGELSDGDLLNKTSAADGSQNYYGGAITGSFGYQFHRANYQDVHYSLGLRAIGMIGAGRPFDIIPMPELGISKYLNKKISINMHVGAIPPLLAGVGVGMNYNLSKHLAISSRLDYIRSIASTILSTKIDIFADINLVTATTGLQYTF